MDSRENTAGGEVMISALSDAELLANTRGLIGRSNQLVAALLAHLGEVEARGLHRTRACSSLFAYCVYELRLSEDEAVRRVTAARLVRKFPELLDAVAAGELHLTGLLLLGPHLTRDNFGEVMAHAKHRSKKEIAKLVRILDPLPDVPARIEALGPVHQGVARKPTWAEQVASFCPVRELTPGDRPKDWVVPVAPVAPVAPEELSAPARTIEPLRFKVQFSTTEEYVDLMERAAALLSNRGEQNGIEEIHLRALRLLVERLENRRFGAPARTAKSPAKSARTAKSAELPKDTSKRPSKPSARRSRHIPAHIRRIVFERDGARCTHVDPGGQRCRDTHHLEFHHLVPFALGGEHTTENLTLRCAAHNTLAAELDFGTEHIARQRNSCLHESERRASLEL
jgi:5-methylcytosine-specific restriction endonuclease McrA